MAQSSSPVSGVAERYAQSLFELAREDGAIETVESELKAFRGLIDENADFRRLVENPVFSPEDQMKAIDEIVTKAGASRLTANFLRLVARNRRLFVLPGMIRSFLATAAAERGEIEAQVTTAHALSDEQRRELAQAVGRYTGKTVTMNETVDPAILGGLVVRIGSRQIDTSLRTKLNSLKLALKEVG